MHTCTLSPSVVSNSLWLYGLSNYRDFDFAFHAELRNPLEVWDSDMTWFDLTFLKESFGCWAWTNR